MDTAYPNLVEDTLRALGGETQYVAGAKLIQAVQRKALASGLDFKGFLKTSDLKFSAYLETLGPRIKVRKRGASDMLVGFEGAPFEVPQSEGGRNYYFRGDLYAAFVKSRSEAFYDPINDRFSTTPSSDSIPLPLVTNDALLAERRRFADTLVSDPVKKQALLDALGDARPLSTFRQTAERVNLGEEWHAFKNRQVRSAVEKWASDNRLDLKESWFKKTPKSNLRSVLIGLASLMTDDELKALSIPLRVVEAYHLKGD